MKCMLIGIFYFAEKKSEKVHKYWAGWCATQAAADPNKIPPESRPYLGNIRSSNRCYLILTFLFKM